jgi:hypothetical protein
MTHPPPPPRFTNSVSSLLNETDILPSASSAAAPAPATEAPRSYGLQTSSADVDPDSEAVRMAIHALGAMRQPRVHDPSSSSATTTATPTAASTAISSPSLATASYQHTPWSSKDGDDEVVDENFIGRVSQLPYVGGALRAYETGKKSNRVVKVRIYPLSSISVARRLLMYVCSTSMEQILRKTRSRL